MRDMRAVVIILAKNNRSPPRVGGGGGGEKRFEPQKILHGKNQRVFKTKKQRSKHEELTCTVRNNLAD